LRRTALACVALYGVAFFRAFIPGACANVSIYAPTAAACETAHDCCAAKPAQGEESSTETPEGLPQPFAKACPFCQLVHSPALAPEALVHVPPADFPHGILPAPAAAPTILRLAGQHLGRAPPRAC